MKFFQTVNSLKHNEEKHKKYKYIISFLIICTGFFIFYNMKGPTKRSIL